MLPYSPTMSNDGIPHLVDLDPTVKVDQLRSAMTADPAVAADKILACMTSLELLHQRQTALEALVAVVNKAIPELRLLLDQQDIHHTELRARFENLINALENQSRN